MLCLISREHPILLMNKKRTILKSNIDVNIYDKYLINLILKMTLENPILRPTASEALDELINIENFIKNPNKENESKIISIIAPENTMNLKGIGEKPEDFESIESKDKKYTILGKGAFGYAEKMKSKLNNKI